MNSSATISADHIAREGAVRRSAVNQESPELVARKRALGRQLAALREAAEIGQQQVAHRTGYSRSSVAHAEAGRQLLSREFWKTADELVAADGALVAAYVRGPIRQAGA